MHCSPRVLKQGVRLFAVLLALLLGARSAVAVVVPDMFTAVVPVAAQSPEEFARGAATGMEQVLVRLTGRTDITTVPAIKAALRTADVYLLQFRYEGQSDQGVLLNVSFDQPLLEKLLRDNKIPLWPADRVPVAVWLILEDASGERSLVNPDSQPALTAALDAVALRRGLVLRYPLLDLADATRIDPLVAWDNRDAKPFIEASVRYEAPAVLVGRFTATSVATDAASYAGSWQMADAQGEKSLNLDDGAWDKHAELGITIAAEILAARYAIAPVAIAGEGTLIEVSNITSFNAYNALLTSVKSLTAVQQVMPQAIDADRVTLRIVAEGQLNQLIDALNRLPALQSLQPAAAPVADPALNPAIDPAAVPAPAPTPTPEAPAAGPLRYQWRG